jgi:hypothetical protein
MKIKIRTQQVVDCPKERRVVPLFALAARANRTQLVCRHCTLFEKATCNYVICKYEGK